MTIVITILNNNNNNMYLFYFTLFSSLFIYSFIGSFKAIQGQLVLY